MHIKPCRSAFDHQISLKRQKIMVLHYQYFTRRDILNNLYEQNNIFLLNNYIKLM